LNPDKIIAIATPWLAKHEFDFIDNLRTPTLAISGDHDFALDKNTLNHAMAKLKPDNPLTLKILKDQDHFFRGSENLLVSEILNWIQ
jgi:alpha/beta superfamily hydrolase